ncbi:hypothetical protein MRX96_043398 [Rhipicephalus microplus]
MHACVDGACCRAHGNFPSAVLIPAFTSHASECRGFVRHRHIRTSHELPGSARRPSATAVLANATAASRLQQKHLYESPCFGWSAGVRAMVRRTSQRRGSCIPRRARIETHARGPRVAADIDDFSLANETATSINPSQTTSDAYYVHVIQPVRS